MNQNNQLTEAEKKEVQEEKRVVFFEGNSWYHRTKELMDDLTTKYSKKGGFKTPEEAEKSYWEYEERYREKQREFQVAFLKSKERFTPSAVYLIWYGLGRAVIEGFRGDSLFIGNTGIRVSQLVSIIMVIVGVVMLTINIIKRYKKAKQT